MEDLAVPIPEPAVDDEPVSERRCGRCQLMFPGDPDIGSLRGGWWLCPVCKEALIGDRSRGRS